MRFPHYIPRNHSNEMPSNCIWVDTETQGKKRAKGGETHHLWFGWACYQRRERGLIWSKPDWHRFTTIDQFWSWVETKTRQKTRLYIFAHNGAFDLPVLNAFSELPNRGFALTNAVVDAPPMILVWKREKATIRFIDTLNLWRVPLKALGESVGLDKLPMPSPKAGKKKWDLYGQRDTEIIRIACLNWFEFLVTHDLGGFAPTLASQSFGSYRHRFMQKGIFIDTNEKAIEMGRAAYLGGRTECFRIGKYTGKFYYIDVNSMYPAVMQSGKFPYKLVGVYGRPTKSEINKWLPYFGMTVECLIETDEPNYPMVHEGKLVFPVGKFTLTLAKPEFKMAWERGHVKHIERIALYDEAELFTDFVDYFYGERLKAKEQGNPAAKFMHRILMNSLYGKFGQRGRRYETVGESEVDSVRVWDELDFDTQEVLHYREFGGIKQAWVEEGESNHSFAAIAATITSAARQVLLNAIETAGRRNVYYCDTDSIVVNKTGYNKMASNLDEAQLGKWALEDTFKEITIHGPKDYKFDETVRVKGVRKNAKWIKDNEVEQDRFTGFKGLLREGSLDAPIIQKTKKKLSRNYTKGTVSKSGIVKPLRINTG